jgi:hypothetical protein
MGNTTTPPPANINTANGYQKELHVIQAVLLMNRMLDHFLAYLRTITLLQQLH